MGRFFLFLLKFTQIYHSFNKIHTKITLLIPKSMNISSNIPCTNGTYTKVTSYNDVENTPTPTDGTATLFFDFEHGVFWSKKFVNG